MTGTQLRDFVLISVCFQVAGSIIGKGGANISKLRNQVSTNDVDDTAIFQYNYLKKHNNVEF